MPRTKEQYEAMREATNDKIQSAAIKLFVQKGFAATGVQDIADEAGISIGLLYRHYKTKAELFSGLVSYAVEGLNTLCDLMMSDMQPKEIIEQIVNEIYADMTSGEDFSNMLTLMTQAIYTDTAVMQEVVTADVKLFQCTEKVIEKGQKLGQFRTGNSAEMAALFFSSIQGLGIMQTALRERFTMPSPKQITMFLFQEEIQ